MAKYLGAAGLAPLESVWVRMAGAGLLLVGVLAFVKPRALRIPRARLLFFAAYAVIAVAGVQALFFAAITRLPVGRHPADRIHLAGAGRALGALRPAGTAAARGLHRRRGRGDRARHRGGDLVGVSLDPVGLLLACCAAVCCAGYFLLSDGFGDDVDPLGLIGWGLLGSAVVLLPISQPWNIPWEASPDRGAGGRLPLPALAAVIWMIVIATVAAYILGVTAIRRLSAAIGSTVASVEVVAGAVIAWVLVGEARSGPSRSCGRAASSSQRLARPADAARPAQVRAGRVA